MRIDGRECADDLTPGQVRDGRAHASACRWRTALFCPVGIACDAHGYDVCPECDRCSCGHPETPFPAFVANAPRCLAGQPRCPHPATHELPDVPTVLLCDEHVRTAKGARELWYAPMLRYAVAETNLRALRALAVPPRPGTRLAVWNERRADEHAALVEHVPGKPGATRPIAGADPPPPPADAMPRCPACEALMRDPVLPPGVTRELTTGVPPTVWCECPACGHKARRVL
jgi:hypothetical protein